MVAAMILSPGRGYVFIHIPKTGGTSLALALEARAMKDDIMLGDTPKARRRRHKANQLPARGRLWKHSTLADIEGMVPDAVLNGLLAFTLVRNPWDRAVSYYHWLRGQSFAHPAVGLAQSLGFGAFLRHPQIRAGFRGHPAAQYLRRSDGRAQTALFIRIEAFAQDAAPLWDHLGFRLELPHENRSDRSDRGDYRSHYTPDTAQIIAQECAIDIAQFGYRFDPVN